MVWFLSDGATQEVPAEAVQVSRKFEPQWKNFITAFIRGGRRGLAEKREPFGRYFLNSVFICTLSILGEVFSCSLVGFAFARLRFVGKKFLFMLMLSTLMVPPQIYMVPVFMIFSTLGWVDTFLPLIVPSFFGRPFFIFLFRQFYLTVPTELEEAARMDGCGPLRIYWHIFFPIGMPVAVTAAVYTFLGAWNDLMTPLIYLSSGHKRTLALALVKYKTAYGYLDIPEMMAVSLLMMLPCILIFFFSQKAITRGMVISGARG